MEKQNTNDDGKRADTSYHAKSEKRARVVKRARAVLATGGRISAQAIADSVGLSTGTVLRALRDAGLDHVIESHDDLTRIAHRPWKARSARS